MVEGEQQPKKSFSITRRNFIGSLTLMAAGAAVGIPGQASAQESNLHGKVGLLLPQNPGRPGPSQRLMRGMQLGAAHAGAAGVEFVSRFGNPYQAVEELLTEGQVSVIVGVVNAKAVHDLVPLLNKHRATLLVADTGADVVQASDHHRAVFYNSLGYWQTSWAIGEWALEHLGDRAAFVDSFLESGYDASVAFRESFEASGGRLVHSKTTHMPNQKTDWEEVTTAIRHASPDFVYAMYAGQDAVAFMRAYEAAGLAGRIPLVGSAFMADEALLASYGAAALGMYSCTPWAASLHNPESAAFAQAHQEATGERPDSLSLLGYDTAHLLIEALRRAGGFPTVTEKVVDALDGARHASPRGLLRMSLSSHTTQGPMYLCQVRQTGSGLYNQPLAMLSPVEERNPSLADLKGRVRTGFVNPYLGA